MLERKPTSSPVEIEEALSLPSFGCSAICIHWHQLVWSLLGSLFHLLLHHFTVDFSTQTSCLLLHRKLWSSWALCSTLCLLDQQGFVSFGAWVSFLSWTSWLASATWRRFSCFHWCKGRWGLKGEKKTPGEGFSGFFGGGSTVGKWKDSNSIRKLMGEMFLRKDFPWTWPKSNGCELYDNVYIHVCIYSVYIYIYIHK